jgi:hypothetical protein
MGRRLIDRTGQRFGRLVVLEQAGRSKQGQVLWRCLCDCGGETTCLSDNLGKGHTKSCGCLKAELLAQGQPTHGLCHTKAYAAFCAAKERCQNPNTKSWPSYGGRGIQFLYASVEALVADIGHPPSADLTIERVDVEGNYEPGNCCWATQEEQANNKRNSRKITFQGRTQTIAQWAREIGVGTVTLWTRLNRYGWPVEKALTTPVKARQ